jgi:hypothetical protein
MNLSRRLQALGLRRKGETPQKIAETLDMPRAGKWNRCLRRLKSS